MKYLNLIREVMMEDNDKNKEPNDEGEASHAKGNGKSQSGN